MTAQRMVLTFLLVVLALSAGTAWSKPFEYDGTVTHITDGDTIKVRTRPRVERGVRIDNIDTPEPLKINAKCGLEIKRGRAATAYLGRILPVGAHVRVAVRRVERHRRDLATVTYQGRDIGRAMVRAGHARSWNGRRPKPGWCRP